jgi:polyisoprenoid-binding protein YceI
MPNDTTNPDQPSAALTALGDGHWTLDPASSSVGFQHKSMWGMANVKGSFTKLSGEGEIGPDGSASGTLVIDAASIDTKKAKLDTHLRSADFFDVTEYPTFTFAATSVKPDAAGNAAVTGNLTVLGTTRELAFTANASAVGTTDVTLTGEVTVNRDDFGMSWNRMGMLKGLTTVTLSIHFSRG